MTTHAAGPFSCLGHDFEVRTGDAALASLIADLFRSLATRRPPQVTYEVLDAAARGPDRVEVRFDGAPTAPPMRRDAVLGHLMWDVNQRAVRAAGAGGDVLAFHAAAAMSGEGALLLPGSSGSGKSTLVAALAGRGLGYLTDEVASLDDRFAVRPYRKPVSIVGEAQRALPHLEPPVAPGTAPYLGSRWLVPLRGLDRDLPVGVEPVTVRWVVVVRFTPGVPTRLEPLSPADAVMALGRHWFDPERHGGRALEALAELVGRVSTFSLEFGDLRTACDAVLDAVSADRAPIG